MNIKDDFILKDINEGYLVGGMVRDFLMGKKSYDRDIAIVGAEEFSTKLSKKLDATLITLDNENKIYRIILKDKVNYLDVSELRGTHKTIEEDLPERDFTINAVAYDLKEEKFIDVCGGISDIETKTLRAIKEKNFIDDPLRILRAFRFMATTGFKPDSELMILLSKHLNLIEKPAKERIHDEILKLFGGRYASQALLKMQDIGLLERLFPCVKEMVKVPKNSHHHLDLIHHSIETVKQIESIYENSQNNVLQHLNKIDFGGYPRINHLKLAGFLHDIGKYSTWTIEESGRHRFIKHDIVGAKLVIPLLKDLKFSNKQIEYLSDLIRYHIYPSSVISAPVLDNKIMMRFVRKMGENAIDIIILAKADRLSAQGPEITAEITKQNINGLNKLLNFYNEVKPTLKSLPKLLSGAEIMQIKNISPSPALGQIISALHEAQLNQEVNTKNDAIEFIRNYQI